MKRLMLLLSMFLLFCAWEVSAEEDSFKIIDATCTKISTTAVELSYDASMDTSWTGEGVLDVWITWEIEKTESVSGISLAFLHGDVRQSIFDIQISTDGVNFTDVLTNVKSSGETTDYEVFSFSSPVRAKYIKFVGYGNTSSLWSNIAEVKILRKLPAEEDDTLSDVQIVSKLDYICDNSMIFQIGSENMLFKNERSASLAPIIINGSTMVPLRTAVDTLGGKLLWDAEARVAACSVDNYVMRFFADSNLMELNGKSIQMNAPARIVGENLMIPMRNFAESIGRNVMWYGAHNIAVICDVTPMELSKWELLELNDRINN